MCGLLGILNSTLLNWIFSTRFYDYEIKPVYLRACPLADVNNSKLVNLVERMLTLHKDKAAARLNAEKAMMQQQIEATDKQIDALVYALYGLTDTEIAVVEGTG